MEGGSPSCQLTVPISLGAEGPPWGSVQAKFNVLPVFSHLGLGEFHLRSCLILVSDVS